VLLTKVAAWVALFHVTVLVGTKPVPVIVSVEPAAAVVTVLGAIPEICGLGLLMARAAALDVPPPGVGFTTATCADPTAATSPAWSVRVSWVLLTKLAAWFAPFHVTVLVATKPVPVIVSVEPAAAVVTVLGETPEICGLGLLMARVMELDAPPPGDGLMTTTCPVPVAARSVAVSPTCNCVELTNVAVRLFWFHCTVDVCIKPVPFTVTVVAAAPTMRVEGDREVITGTGFDDGGVDTPPPPPQAEKISNEMMGKRAAYTGFVDIREDLVQTITGFSGL